MPLRAQHGESPELRAAVGSGGVQLCSTSFRAGAGRADSAFSRPGSHHSPATFPTLRHRELSCGTTARAASELGEETEAQRLQICTSSNSLRAGQPAWQQQSSLPLLSPVLSEVALALQTTPSIKVRTCPSACVFWVERQINAGYGELSFCNTHSAATPAPAVLGLAGICAQPDIQAAKLPQTQQAEVSTGKGLRITVPWGRPWDQALETSWPPLSCWMVGRDALKKNTE